MFPARSGLFPRLAVPALVGVVLSLSGCSANFGGSADSSTATSFSIKGVTHGGQQPLFGSHVHLLAAGTSGYASAATDVLTSGSLPSDSFGHYVTTDASGNFSLAGTINCTATAGNDQLLYLYSTEGDPQPDPTPVPNTSVGLMAVVGACSTIANIPFVFMNEVTTVAAAYALAGFAVDPTHIGAPSAVTGHALAGTGITNAFNTALNIVGQTTGQPLTTTPAGNGTVPVSEINTLADILASCINSTGGSACTPLFSNALSGGTTGATPTDTAMAAINIAHNPTVQITNLLGLANNGSPFQPFLTSTNNFTLGVAFVGGGLQFPGPVAIDGAGNVWIANGNAASLSEFSSLGAVLSGPTGYTGGGLSGDGFLAIETSGNVWVSNPLNTSLSEFSSSGTAITGPAGISGGGINDPQGIAIDGFGNIWVAETGGNSLTEFNPSTRTPISQITGGGLNDPEALAIDGSGNIWVTNIFGSSASEFNASGQPIASPSGVGGLNEPEAVAIDDSGNAWIANFGNSFSEFNSSGVALSGGYGGGGLNGPDDVAIDGSGNVWAANRLGATLSEFNSTGTPISPPGGYTGGGLNEPTHVAIDGSGNVWTGNGAGNSLTELIGAATPVVTPLAANLSTGTKQPAQKP
ncbi:NHL repeat-containing protein [Granulicella mallensis]|nr:NHL repeat-containing protein [Granulicella mallensis]